MRGFQADARDKENICMLVQETKEMQVQSLDQEDLLEEGLATHSSMFPGESHGQKSLAGYSP